MISSHNSPVLPARLLSFRLRRVDEVTFGVIMTNN
jgi:hypothetical protein